MENPEAQENEEIEETTAQLKMLMGKLAQASAPKHLNTSAPQPPASSAQQPASSSAPGELDGLTHQLRSLLDAQLDGSKAADEAPSPSAPQNPAAEDVSALADKLKDLVAQRGQGVGVPMPLNPQLPTPPTLNPPAPQPQHSEHSEDLGLLTEKLKDMVASQGKDNDSGPQPVSRSAPQAPQPSNSDSSDPSDITKKLQQMMQQQVA